MSENISSDTQEIQELNEILRIRREKLRDLQDKGRDPFCIVRYDVTHKTKEIIDSFEELDGKLFPSQEGLWLNVVWENQFRDIQDRDGKIQLFVRINELGEEAYEEFKKLDIGDIIGVSGTVFKTRMGEISVKSP